MCPNIEDDGSGGGFQQVKRKVTGTVRKNSLALFLDDHRDLAALKPYQVQKKQNQAGRTTLYLKPKAAVADVPSFQGIPASETHISVDFDFSQEGAAGARGFGPAHLTVSYGSLYTLHVYFNKHGKMIDHHVKSLADETYLDLTPDENAQIRRQAAPVEALLQSLIAEKQQAYQALDEQLMQQEMALSQMTTKPAYIAKAHECLALAKQLNRYSDTVELRREALIEEKIAYFEEAKPTAAPAVAPERPKAAAAEAASVPDETTPERAPQKTITMADRKEALVASINALNAQHAEEQPLSVLLPLFFKVETLALDIVFESKAQAGQSKGKKGKKGNKGKASDSEEKFLQAQKQRMTFNLEQVEIEFRERLAAGDLAYVKDAYPQLVGVIPMGIIFNDFIRDLPDRFPDDLVLKKLAVADYLYHETETYRSLFLITLRSVKLLCQSMPGIQIAYLAEFFLRKNWVGFQAMLEKYGEFHDKEQLFCSENHVALNMIQTILFFYKDNPDIRFLDALLAHGMPLTHRRENHNRNGMFDIEMRGDRLVQTGLRRNPQKANAATLEGSTYRFISGMRKDNHALKTSLKPKCLVYPEVAARLLEYTDDIELLFECLAELSQSDFIGFHFDYRIYQNETTVKIITDYALKVTPEGELVENIDDIWAFASQLEAKVHTLFKGLSPEAQRDLMRQLFERGKQAQGSAAEYLLVSAQIAYTMLAENTPADDKFMCKIALHRAHALGAYLGTIGVPAEVQQEEVKKAGHFLKVLKEKNQLEAQVKGGAVSAPSQSVFSPPAADGSDDKAAEAPDTPKPKN